MHMLPPSPPHPHLPASVRVLLHEQAQPCVEKFGELDVAAHDDVCGGGGEGGGEKKRGRWERGWLVGSKVMWGCGGVWGCARAQMREGVGWGEVGV